jgi:hypothetical protein
LRNGNKRIKDGQYKLPCKTSPSIVEKPMKDCFFKSSLVAEIGDRDTRSHDCMPCIDSHCAMKNALEETNILLWAMFIPYICPAGLVGCRKDAMPFLHDGFGKLSTRVEQESAKFGVI